MTPGFFLEIKDPVAEDPRAKIDKGKDHTEAKGQPDKFTHFSEQ